MILREDISVWLPKLLTYSDELELPDLKDFYREQIIEGSYENLRFYRESGIEQPDTFDRLITDFWASALFNQKSKLSKDKITHFLNDVIELSKLSRSSYPIDNLDYFFICEARNNKIGDELADIVENASKNADPWVSEALFCLSKELR